LREEGRKIETSPFPPWYKFIGGPTSVPEKYGQAGKGLQYLIEGWPEGNF